MLLDTTKFHLCEIVLIDWELHSEFASVHLELEETEKVTKLNCSEEKLHASHCLGLTSKVELDWKFLTFLLYIASFWTVEEFLVFNQTGRATVPKRWL